LKVSDETLARVNLTPARLHGEWNYSPTQLLKFFPRARVLTPSPRKPLGRGGARVLGAGD